MILLLPGDRQGTQHNLTMKSSRSDRLYWVVSPNVKNNNATVAEWAKLSLRTRGAFMGWPLNHPMGRKFAGLGKQGITPGDVILIARRYRGRPEIIGFGVVRGKYLKKIEGIEVPDSFGSFRRLSPFRSWSQSPLGIPIIDALPKNKALVQLHPEGNNAHRKVCNWMTRQLGSEGPTDQRQDRVQGRHKIKGMKMAVLKPIMWNGKGYKRPAGFPSKSGYSHDYGYGHEEWNNNPRWLWRGYRVFHTESTAEMSRAAENGELGMVMIASHAGKPYALGVATNIYANAKDEQVMIANAVGVFNEWPAVWSLATVRRCFANQAAFLRHWRAQYRNIRWKCQPDDYYWFPQPIQLDPHRLTGKKKLSMHHGRFTLTTSDVLLDIVDAHLPKNRTAIRDWLSFGDFMPPRAVPQSKGQISGSQKRRQIQRSRNAPTDHRFQYWVQGKRTVDPLHDRLQGRFVQYLKTARHIKPRENYNYIDVQYVVAGATVFCEIKPTDNVETRYAIRLAIGQLLEHRYKHNAAAALEIVVGNKPQAEEVAFVKSIGLRLIYYDAARKTFVST